jgi:hypothetical protein
MLDTKTINISKMNSLRAALDAAIHNSGGKPVVLKDVVEDAEKLVSWLLNPELKYVKTPVKETK